MGSKRCLLAWIMILLVFVVFLTSEVAATGLLGRRILQQSYLPGSCCSGSERKRAPGKRNPPPEPSPGSPYGPPVGPVPSPGSRDGPPVGPVPSPGSRYGPPVGSGSG